MVDRTETPPPSGFLNWLARHTTRTVYTAAIAAAVASVASVLATWAVYEGAKKNGTPVPENIPKASVILVAGAGVELDDGPRGMGWANDPQAVEQVIASLPTPLFAATPAGVDGDIPPQVFLWEAARKVLKKDIPTRDQGDVGSCVANGAATGGEYIQCVQIASGKPGTFLPLSPEVIYGGSRVQIGGGQIRGDGSVGAWAARWLNQYGAVSATAHGKIDLSSYSVERCRQYGDRGCPAELVPVAKQSPIRSVALVRTPEECRRALANGYPVTVASSIGFGSRGPYVRDAQGFLRASGTWYHQMVILGYQSARPGFLIMNSWGPNWVSGPAGAGNPPPGSFWVDEATVNRMLAQNDSWAFSDAVGFPARKLDLFIRAPQLRPAPLQLRGVSWTAA